MKERLSAVGKSRCLRWGSLEVGPETKIPLEIYQGDMGKGWGRRTEKGRKPSNSVISGKTVQRVASARPFRGTLDGEPCLRIVLICDKLAGLSNSDLELLVKGPSGKRA